VRSVVLLGISVVALASGCSSPQLGFGVALTIKADVSVPNDQLAAVKSLSFSTTGDETETTVQTLDRALTRQEEIVYRPSAATRVLVIEVEGLDANHTPIVEGVTATLTLFPNRTTDADVDLRLVSSVIDQSMPINDDGAVLPDLLETGDAGTPTVTIAATPASIVAGGSSTLVWSSMHATSCTASGAWSGTKAASGSLTVTPSMSSTYTLVCDNGSLTSAPATASVNVTSASGPVLVQYVQALPPNTGSSAVQFTSPTKAGNTLWVVASVYNNGGSPAISVKDSAGNTFTRLDQQDDSGQGRTTLAHFYAANIAGDAGQADTVTIVWADGQFKAVLIAEVSGASTTPLVGHNANTQDGLGAGTDNVSSGGITIAAAQTPALMLAISGNDTSAGGVSAPAAGTGFTSVASIWDIGQNLGTFETRTYSTGGLDSALFSAPQNDSYLTVAAVFH
jgi:hypothetical protein